VIKEGGPLVPVLERRLQYKRERSPFKKATGEKKACKEFFKQIPAESE